MYDHTSSKIANHQIRRQAIHKIGCQYGDCIYAHLMNWKCIPNCRWFIHHCTTVKLYCWGLKCKYRSNFKKEMCTRNGMLRFHIFLVLYCEADVRNLQYLSGETSQYTTCTPFTITRHGEWGNHTYTQTSQRDFTKIEIAHCTPYTNKTCSKQPTQRSIVEKKVMPCIVFMNVYLDIL